MKKLITPIIALTLIFASCTATTDKVETIKDEVNTESAETSETEDVGEAETENEDLINAEGTAVEGDRRFDNMCQESLTSDCYVVSHFIDMDINYITVDFVENKEVFVKGGTEPEYHLVNDNPKLRTFQVNETYFDCSHSDKVPLSKLLETAKKDPKTLFMITTEEGSVTELFVRRCAG